MKTGTRSYYSRGGVVRIRRKYPTDWYDVKKVVAKRDGGRCVECGLQTPNLHHHHIKRLSRGGTNSRMNLVSLCEKCHSKKHGGRDVSRHK